MTPETISVDELAELGDVTGRTVRTLISKGVLPESDRGQLPWKAAIKALIAHKVGTRSSKADVEAEKVRNLRLDAETKERQRAKDTGEWIESRVWLDKLDEHIGDLRTALKNIFILEQPATLSGRSEIDIRELNQKTLTSLFRRMQNAAGRLKPETKEV